MLSTVGNFNLNNVPMYWSFLTLFKLLNRCLSGSYHACNYLSYNSLKHVRLDPQEIRNLIRPAAKMPGMQAYSSEQ